MDAQRNAGLAGDNGVPLAITVGGKTYRTVFMPDLASAHSGCGRAEYDDAIIRLQPCVEGYTMARDAIQECYWHEVVHVILHAMGRRDMRDDEQFVSAFGTLLHQVVKTADRLERDGAPPGCGSVSGHQDII